jgi:enoyl-CoA hydratase/carnithine racemase
MTRTTVREERHGHVLLLTLHRPERRNAFNDQQYDDLRDALAGAQDDAGVRAVVITGAPGAFSGGQDIAEMGGVRHADGQPHGFVPFVDRLAAFDKPLLAAVNGVAVGIGVTMLFHCDVVYVAERARLRLPFVSLGIAPEAGSTYLLPALIGAQRTAELFFTGEWVDSGRAVSLGLAARAVPDGELLPVTLARAGEIAAQPPGAVRAAKRLLLAARADAVAAARAREDATNLQLGGSEENRAAIQAFLQRKR